MREKTGPMPPVPGLYAGVCADTDRNSCPTDGWRKCVKSRWPTHMSPSYDELAIMVPSMQKSTHVTASECAAISR